MSEASYRIAIGGLPLFSRRLWVSLLLALSAVLLSAPAWAAATAWVGDAHANARLITAVEAAGSAHTIDAGFEIGMAPGWHAYWRTPGAAGVAPTFDWTGSENVAAASVDWPAPTRLTVQELETYVYPDHVVLPITITPATPGQPVKLRASVDYAACSDVCVPYHADLTLALPAGLATPGNEAPLIAEGRARVPASLEQAGLSLASATVTPAGEHDAQLTVRLVSNVTLRAPDVFVEGLEQAQAGHPIVTLTDNRHAAEFDVPVSGATAAALAGKPLSVTVTDGAARAATFSTTPALGSSGPAKGASRFAIIGIAVLGGLILNLMPCVLPVLSLKLIGVAGLVGRERRAVRLNLLATASGVLASFAVLAAALIGLKAAGAAIGWGIQFQQPWFLAVMATITVLFAASLWDWLGIRLPGIAYAVVSHEAHHPLSNAFLTGAFATLLATSCSAPFVGTAVGFALARGPGDIIGVFAALGLGLASPYLAIAGAPGVVRLLPKPGRWMLWLRRVLGLALLGTAAWLITVLAQEAGLSAAMASGAALLILLAILRWRARRAVHGRPMQRATALAMAAAVLAAILGPQLAAETATSATEPPRFWQRFDQAAILRHVADGKIVFVDVTAAWCLTCKVNEATVLSRSPVADRLRDPGVVAMRADWTRPDPAITAYLQSFGRFGVPLDVVYGPGTPAGEALPELLTTPAVMQAFQNAAAANTPVASARSDAQASRRQE